MRTRQGHDCLWLELDDFSPHCSRECIRRTQQDRPVFVRAGKTDLETAAGTQTMAHPATGLIHLWDCGGSVVPAAPPTGTHPGNAAGTARMVAARTSAQARHTPFAAATGACTGPSCAPANAMLPACALATSPNVHHGSSEKHRGVIHSWDIASGVSPYYGSRLLNYMAIGHRKGGRGPIGCICVAGG